MPDGLSKKSKAAKHSSGASGALGGPATGHGINYQINYGLLRALDLILKVLSEPFSNPEICIEPRILSERGATKWDLAINPPESLAEAKLNPTKGDILEWLDRVREQATSSPAKQFLFVYSKGGGQRLTSLGKLIRIAEEAGTDEEQFDKLTKLENIPGGESLLERLGATAHCLLLRMHLCPIPEAILEQDIEFRATSLAGIEGGRRLTEMLFRRFADAIPKRKRFLVSELTEQVKRDGIKLQGPPELNFSGLKQELAIAFSILQMCPLGLPLDVLAQTAHCDASQLEVDISALTGKKIVMFDAGLWRLAPLASLLPKPGPDVCASALKAVLAFIDKNKHEQLGRNQLHNAIALAKACRPKRPESVSGIFMILDKPLKRLGDKQLVLEIAELTIESARRSKPRTVEEVRSEAQALICGKSWVFQRIGRLEEARAAARKSLELGEDIGWQRNTAFCNKCVGRLYRIEAEEEKDEAKRLGLLTQSESSLQTAIGQFIKMPDFGPGDPEVGDCHSLLGRTYLVAGKINNARAAIIEADRLITDSTSKDYLDLLILKGDFQARIGNRQAAETFYDDALAEEQCDDSERSEIRARAYFRRAINSQALAHTERAITDFEKASGIWRDLGEHGSASKAEWQRLRLTESLSPEIVHLLGTEPIPVRVAAVHSHHQRMTEITGRRVARRTEPGIEYWKQLIREARKQVAIEDIEW